MRNMLVVVVVVVVVVVFSYLVELLPGGAVWCEGGYVGLWSWLRLSVFSSWTKVRDRVVSDPRFDVILPPPVRRVLHWIFRLDSKVTTATNCV